MVLIGGKCRDHRPDDISRLTDMPCRRSAPCDPAPSLRARTLGLPSRDAAHGTLRSRGRICIQSNRFAVALTPRPGGRVHIVGAGPVGLFLAALLQSVDGQLGPPLRAPTRVHAHPHGVARPVPRSRLARELQGGHDRLGERRGHLRADRARNEDGVPPFRRRRPACPARRVDARVHRAEDHRAVAQRADRRARHRHGRARRRRGVRRASPVDGGAGRHPRRLHRHPVAPARPPAAGR